VTFDVQDGEIVSAEWNGANRENGTAKVTRSESGEYGMVENSLATVPWYEQIRAVEEWLIQNQDPAGLPIDDTGVTDAVSGVSVTVDSHFALAEEALAGADR
jgi:hypothetical protein